MAAQGRSNDTTASDAPASCVATLLRLRFSTSATSRPPPRWISSAALSSQKARLVVERADLGLHKIRAEVEKQQEHEQQEEDDDQDSGHEADEEIRQDQLAPHAPQQPLFRDREQPEQQCGGARGDREAGDGVDDADKGGGAGRRQAKQRDEQLDGDAEDDDAARP